MIGLGVGGGGLFALILVVVAGVVMWHRRRNQTPHMQEEEARGDHGDLALSSITPNGGHAAGTQDVSNPAHRGGTGGETSSEACSDGDIDRHGRLAKLSTEKNAAAEDAGVAGAFSARSPWGGGVEEQRGEGGEDSLVHSAEGGGAEAKTEKAGIP